MNDEVRLADLFARRGSVRDYLPHPPPESLIDDILDAARRAPSSSNAQAYSIVVVRDEERRRRLAELTGHQAHVAQAPVFLAFCADLSRMGRACQWHGVEFRGSAELTLMATIDASLVGMAVSMLADGAGLGSVMIGGTRNRPVEVAQLLDLPPAAYVVFGMCLGWPAQRPRSKPRLPREAVVHHECHDTSGADEAMLQYEEQLSDYYTRSPDHVPWIRRLSRLVEARHREDLADQLRMLGLDLS